MTAPDPALETDQTEGFGPEVETQLDLDVFSTGSSEVDAALSPLRDLTEVPVAEHPAHFNAALNALTAILDERGEPS